MDALGDLVAREHRSGFAASSLPSQRSGRRRSDDPALLAPGENRSYDYHRFCTTAWKTGNFWRRRGVHASDEVTSVGSSDERSESDGVHEDATVAVADDSAPEAIFAFLGAALLGARTRFGPPDASATNADLDARVAVAPREEIADYDLPPGGQRVAYGGPPDDPAIAHFERDVWSENPAFPDTPIDPETAALVTENREFSHADLLAAAREIADDWELESGDEVAVRAPLAEPGTVVAGVVAPLLAGAAILLPEGESPERDVTGGYAVEDDDVPENGVVRPKDAI